MRANATARPEQSQFPLTTQDAADAASLWFAQRIPSMTLGAWRDYLCTQHLKAIRCDDWQERAARTVAWNASLNTGLERIMVGCTKRLGAVVSWGA